MKRGLLRWCGGLALGFAMLADAAGQGGETKRAGVPAVRGTTLAGGKVALPEDLKGKTGVLIVGFSKGASAEAAAWGKRLAGDKAHSGDLVYYEVAMLEGVPRLLRGIVLKQIKSSVSEAGQAHFLPVYEHQAEWKAAAGYTRPDDAYVLVVDGTGAVRARIQGAPTDVAYVQLLQGIQPRRER